MPLFYYVSPLPSGQFHGAINSLFGEDRSPFPPVVSRTPLSRHPHPNATSCGKRDFAHEIKLGVLRWGNPGWSRGPIYK